MKQFDKFKSIAMIKYVDLMVDIGKFFKKSISKTAKIYEEKYKSKFYDYIGEVTHNGIDTIVVYLKKDIYIREYSERGLITMIDNPLGFPIKFNHYKVLYMMVDGKKMFDHHGHIWCRCDNLSIKN